MAPSTTLSLQNTTAPIYIPKPTSALFLHDFGTFLGFKILYLIIAAVALLCILCCIIFLCCNCRRQSQRNRHKHKHKQSLPVEMTSHDHGMPQLNWKYTVKSQSVNIADYKSALDTHTHKNSPNTTANNESNNAFNRVINDRKTTVSHNPLQSQSPNSAQNPMSFSNTNTENRLYLQQNNHTSTYASHPQSMPNNNNNNMGSFPQSDYTNYNKYQYPQTMPNNNGMQIASDEENDLDNFDKVTLESSDEYKTEFTETQIETQIEQTLSPRHNNNNGQIVDTLTNIVNRANNNDKQVTHVLSLNKLDMTAMMAQSSMASSINMNREPSPAPTATSVATSEIGFPNTAANNGYKNNANRYNYKM